MDKIIDNRQRDRLRLLEKQIQRMQKHVKTLEPLSNRYSWIRVLLFFGGLGISLIVLIAGYWWLALPLAILSLLAFAIVAQLQSRIDRSIGQHSLWRHIKSAHVARIKLNWNDIPVAPADPPPADHPFAYDLDITGKHSIHRLLNTAISREGSQKLCDWLLQTNPNLTTIRSRQDLIHELTPMTRFRDKLILKSLQTSGRLAEDLEGQRLLNWLNKSNSSPWLLLLLWLSLAINLLIVVFIALSVTGIGPNIWGLMIVFSLLFFLATGSLRGDIFEDAGYINYGFSTLNSIFSYLEKYPYKQKHHLKTLCEPFFRDHVYGPSQLLTKLAHLASAATLRKNPYLWLPLNVLLPWDAYCAYRLSKYKHILRERLPEWLDTWFELEALCSLACFAYLNPAYTLPDIQPAEPEEASFHGRNLGHPLIPAEKKVTNDFSIDKNGSVIILTGSNMAGKSTFLRTLGVNLCLAYAGGPVNASHLQASLFRIFTCIRVSDSVTDGYSYFFAEVKRLRALLDALHVPQAFPLFFLIDEIFKGTNNRERLIGSRSYAHAVTGQNCVGAISTHDLELVKLEDDSVQIHNFHFREEVIEGQLQFDYVLRPGPCPTTNALKLMELEGLPVNG